MDDTQVNASPSRMPRLEMKSLKSPKELLKLIFLEPYEILIQVGVLKLLFTLKLVLILPFVNLPSFFRITQQISEAANPMDAEPLSGAWIICLGVYILVNFSGLLCAILIRKSKYLLTTLMVISLIVESLLSFFYSYLFDASASLASALGPFSMAILAYRLLLGYRFGILQSVATFACVLTLYLGQTTAGWPSAPILAEPQLSPKFSVFELNFILGWYIWVALGSNVIANFIQGLRLKVEQAHAELQELNQYMTERVLKRYVQPKLIDEILAGRLSMETKAESRTITVMFTDLKGFTSASEKIAPDDLAKLLNDYLSEMNAIIFQHDGTIDKFIGDAVMVVFGAPAPLSENQQIQKAVKCALEMQARMPPIAQSWQAAGADEISMRIGIHHGPAIVGNFGSQERTDYTCIGPTVNLASRIETACPPGTVSVSSAVAKLLTDEFTLESLGKFNLKGMTEEQELYRVTEESTQRS